MKQIALGEDLLGIQLEAKDLPVGTILNYGGKDAPAGFLVCDGSEFSEDDYPELATVLESTTLPDAATFVAVTEQEVEAIISSRMSYDETESKLVIEV